MGTHRRVSKTDPSRKKLPTLLDVEAALDERAAAWAGRCYEIASECVRLKIVPGVAVYGHFLGKVAPESHFGDRSHHPFQQHGWVQMPDGRIWDPTRWSFEGVEPYIYVGENKGEYDEGGNALRQATHKPPPPFNRHGKTYDLAPRILPADAWNRVEELLGNSYDEAEVEEVGKVSDDQLFWLANLPYDAFGKHAEAIYKAIEAVGMAGFIPIDNRRRAARESAASHLPHPASAKKAARA